MVGRRRRFFLCERAYFWGVVHALFPVRVRFVSAGKWRYAKLFELRRIPVYVHFFSFCTRGGRLQISSSAIRQIFKQTSQKVCRPTHFISLKKLICVFCPCCGRCHKKRSRTHQGFPNSLSYFLFFLYFFRSCLREGKGRANFSSFSAGTCVGNKKEKDRKKRITRSCIRCRLHWSNFRKEKEFFPHTCSNFYGKRGHMQSPLLFCSLF